MHANSLFVLGLVALLLFGCTSPGQQSAPSGGTPPGGAPSGGQGQATPPSGGTPPAGETKTDLTECTTSCNTLVDSELADTCRMGCHMQVAEEERDAGKCEPILSIEKNGTLFHDACVNSVAEKTGDAAVCAKSKDSTFADICVSSIAEDKGDVELCMTIGEEVYKNACISAIAEDKGDPSLCARITDEYYRESCQESAG